MTPPASTLSIIASGMQVTGDVRCDGVLRIDGTLQGSILGARQLLVTPGGRVHGDVQADEIVVGGEIDGNVRASVRLELQGTAVVNGNIETRAFVVPEGGRVNGDIRMIGGERAGRAEPLRLQAPPPPPPELPAPAKRTIAELDEPERDQAERDQAERDQAERDQAERVVPDPEASEAILSEAVGSDARHEEGASDDVAIDGAASHEAAVESGESDGWIPESIPNATSSLTTSRPLSRKERRKLKRKG